jgi:N-methylhydantoinase A
MGYRVGVDIGGSFTDFAVFDEATSQLQSLKVFSRPDEPGAEVLEGIRLIRSPTSPTAPRWASTP